MRTISQSDGRARLCDSPSIHWVGMLCFKLCKLKQDCASCRRLERAALLHQLALALLNFQHHLPPHAFVVLMRQWLAVAAGSGVQVLCVAMATDVLRAHWVSPRLHLAAALHSHRRCSCTLSAGAGGFAAVRVLAWTHAGSGAPSAQPGAAAAAAAALLGWRTASLRTATILPGLTAACAALVNAAVHHSGGDASGAVPLSLFAALFARHAGARRSARWRSASSSRSTARSASCTVSVSSEEPSFGDANSSQREVARIPCTLSTGLIYDAFDAACVPRAAACYIAWPTMSNVPTAFAKSSVSEHRARTKKSVPSTFTSTKWLWLGFTVMLAPCTRN